MKNIVMGIRDTAGGIHILRLRQDECLGVAVRNLTNSVIAAGRAPAVVLTCLPGGKAQ